MKKYLIIVLVFSLLLSNIAYAENFLHIEIDVASNDIKVDSNINYSNDFDANDYIQNLNRNKLFMFSYMPEKKLDDFKLKIILPENSIVSEKNNVLLLTRPVDITTDGKRIYLTWKRSLELNDQFTVFVQYQPKELFNNYYIYLIIIGFLSFSIGYFIKTNKKSDKIKRILSVDEKKVVKIIRNNKEITQNEIKNELNWSKTKTSKIIRNLEMKNIITKIPYKKTNKLKLK